MLNYASLRTLAKEMQVPTGDLLALAYANDPFYAGVGFRQVAAEWFANLCAEIGFGYRFHIRRAHYKIVSQRRPILKPDGTPYENTKGDWAFLTQASRDARYLGLIDPVSLIDNRNPEATLNVNFGLDAADPSIEVISKDLGQLSLPDTLELPELILRDFYAQQKYLVEVWTEKSGQNDVLLPLTRRYGVNLINFDGECSEIGCRESINRAVESKRPMRILYLSDFDPGGRSMPVAAARKIEFWLRHNHPDLDVTVDPLALLPEQAEHYGLPRTPIKVSEKRATKFENDFGIGATEIDALEAIHPGVLRKIVEAGILRHIDPDLEERVREAKASINCKLYQVDEDVHDKYRERIDAVQEEYSQLCEQLNEFRERAIGRWEEIADALETEAPYVSADDVPDPRDESDQLAALFDSRRDYLAQIDFYRRWQQRDGGQP